MAVFSSSTPSDGTTDYFINKSLEVTFDEAVNAATLTDNVVSLYNLDTGAPTPIELKLKSTDSNTIVITPSSHLQENTNYRLVILGTDMGLGFNLSFSGGSNLATTVAIMFMTGDSVYSIDTTVEKEAASKTLEGDLFLPVNVKALGFDFTVSRVRPENHSYGVQTGLTGDNTINFKFNKALYTASGVTDWATVHVFSLLDDPAYYASGQVFNSTTNPVAVPDYSIQTANNDTELVIAFSGLLPNNAAIQVELNSNIRSTDGDLYGGNLLYSINTELFPATYGVETVKREVKPIAEFYNDDYIAATLFKNIIWLWEMSGRGFSLTDPTYPAKQYAIYSTILDLMEDKEYEKYVVAGTRRQLGDLNVSVDNLIGRQALKLNKYTKAKERAFETLHKGWQFKIGTTTAAYSDIASTINRLWYNVNGRYTHTMYRFDQRDIPASNTSLSRHAKTNNPIWY